MATSYEEVQKNRAVATPAQSNPFPSLLAKMGPEIERALPKHMSADRMLRIALTEFRKNPKLAKCEPQSILASVVVLSQLGLEPGVLGQAYLIPYKDKCQPVPGWQGIADLVSRSGRASVWTGAVYEGDEFEYNYGDRPFITHKPGDDEGGELKYVYAVGRIRNAEYPVIEVWSTAKVTKHRNRYNKVGNDHYSYQHFEMYARKVALLQVIKYMPKSVELATAVDLENAAQTGVTLDLKSVGDPIYTTPEESGPTPPSAGDAPPSTSGEDAAATNKPKATRASKPKEPEQKEPDQPAAEEPQTAKTASSDPPEQLNFSQAMNAITRAKTVDDLDLIRSQITDLKPVHQESLNRSIQIKVDQINGTPQNFDDGASQPARGKTKGVNLE